MPHLVPFITQTTEGFTWDDLRTILHVGQMMAKIHSGEEIGYCRKVQPPE